MSFIKNTPAIKQQRIIIIAFAVIISVLVWWQQAGDRVNYAVQTFLPMPVADAVVDLDFTNAEAAWSNLQFDAQGNLQINAMTETALLDAIALISEPDSESQMARLAQLLEKQFGVNASNQIMALLPLLKNYKTLEQRWLVENQDIFPLPHEQLFQLQDELFGKALAAKMFAEQRRLSKLMLATHQIQNDSSLTLAEKEKALMQLQTDFQTNLQDSDPESAASDVNF